MSFKGAEVSKKKRSGFSPSYLETAGTRVLSQLPATVQNWVRAEANMLVSKGQFGLLEQKDLALRADRSFPNADQPLIVIAVRYLALKASTGGALNRLYGNAGGLTTFQQQLLTGVRLIR